MKAVRFSAYGGPEVLHLDEVDEPHAGAGQIRIAVRAAGVNGIDWKIRSGRMTDAAAPAEPSGAGFDASGVVDEVGDGVTGVAIGDAVFGSGTATYAEFAVLSNWAPKPEAMSFEEAAGYPIAVETAQRILDQVGVRPGETLLVSGATGGVGSAVVQFAKQRDVTVIGTASARNQDYLRSLGAVATTYGEGLVDRVRALAPDGVDAALHIGGAGVLPELIDLTGDPAKVLSIVDFSAPSLGAQVSSKTVNAAGAYAAAAQLYAIGEFHLPVDSSFPLAQAGAAQAASEAGHATGRIVLTVP
ncbi:MAG TPA: NADP-dependent oxidoreductase [Micromonosporaceae bacterium]|jgi:NADPH:quinone reductase-like Zn-dependent oxidoreductase